MQKQSAKALKCPYWMPFWIPSRPRRPSLRKHIRDKGFGVPSTCAITFWMGLPPSTQAAHRPQHELSRASGRRGRVSHGQHVLHTRFQWPPTKQLTKEEKGRQVDLLVTCIGSIQERLLLQMLHCNPSCSIWFCSASKPTLPKSIHA